MAGAPRANDEERRLEVLRSFELFSITETEPLDRICAIVASVLETPIALLSISDQDKQVFIGKTGFEGKELARELAPCAYAILGRRPLIINDLSTDPRFIKNPLVTDDPNLRFYAGAPLIAPENYALGTLCGLDVRPRELTESQVITLENLSKTAMTIINMHRALTRMKEVVSHDRASAASNLTAFRHEIEKLISDCKEDGLSFAIGSLLFTRPSLSSAIELEPIAIAVKSVLPEFCVLGWKSSSELLVLMPGNDEQRCWDLMSKLEFKAKEVMLFQNLENSVVTRLKVFDVCPNDSTSALAAC